MLESVVLKIITAGDGGVGKTTLLHRYVEDIFVTDTKITIGVDFRLKEMILGNMRVSLQLWDFTGQEHLRHLLEQYSYGAQGALFMFDLSNITRSLRNVDIWWNMIRKHAEIPVILIGTKLDLIEESPMNQKRYELYENMIEEARQKYPFLEYIKTSSKSGENVEKAFEILVTHILRKGD